MRIFIIILIFVICHPGFSQTSYSDSLLKAVESAPNDSVRFSIYKKLSDYYNNKDRRMAFEFNEAALEVARKNNMKLEVAISLGDIGYYLNKEDRYGEAFKRYIEGIHLTEDPANELLSWSKPVDADPYQYRMQILAWLHHDFGHVYRSTNNNAEAILQFRKCKKYLEKALPTSYNTADMNIGAVYLDMNILDSALHYQKKELLRGLGWRSVVYKYIGDVYFRKGSSDSAFIYYHRGLQLSTERSALSQKIICEMSLAQWHLAEENIDSSLFYASRFLFGIKKLQGNPLKDINISNAYELLYQAYQLHGQQDSTLKYLQLAFTARDSVYQEKFRNMAKYQNLSFAEQLRLEELEKEKLETQSRIRIYSLLAGLVLILFIAGALYRQSRQKQKANRILQNAYSKLQSTQSQLIHAEKMASLGELTAGIAHEIQNPLNFVNNFSDVSVDLIEEMDEEMTLGNTEDVKDIASDLKQNLEKIHHHGKRASFIVQGMLEHSRSNPGDKVPTNINALADEFLRLSYHGLRAKDKSFNAEIITEFAEDLPEVNVIPQDFGRVLLNLINNAFYACAERNRSTVAEKQKTQKEGYNPTVIVGTKRIGNNVEIRVNDNGNGIPDEVLKKIFQPFFTTKPTGEGTGLGLSMSYDIITKGHDGKLNVETNLGEGTTFIIQLNIITL